MRGCSPFTRVSTNYQRFSIVCQKMGLPQQNDDEYLCDKEVAYMLKVSRRTLSEYRSNGTLPYYVLGGKVLYKRSEIEQALKREYNGKHLMNGSG